MKKIIAVLLAMLMLLSTAGCAKKDTPSAAVEQHIKQQKKEYSERWSCMDADFYNGSGLTPELIGKMIDMFNDFEFKIENEELTEDGAKVLVSVKSYNFMSIAFNYLGEVLEQTLSFAVSEEAKNATEDTFVEMQRKIFEDVLDAAKKEGKTYSSYTTFWLKQEDSKWVVCGDDAVSMSGYINQLGGNILDAFDMLYY